MRALSIPAATPEFSGLSLSPSTTLNETVASYNAPSPLAPHHTDDLWQEAIEKALDRLPEKDAKWLADENNRLPLTSTRIVEVIQAREGKYHKHPVQTLFAKIDPIISHVRSFAQVITTFVQSDPTRIAGLIWGSLYMVLRVGNCLRPPLSAADRLCRSLVAINRRWSPFCTFSPT